jgi:hypothetical protein
MMFACYSATGKTIENRGELMKYFRDWCNEKPYTVDQWRINKPLYVTEEQFRYFVK